MGFFDLDFTGADAGSLIGGAVGGGFLGPPGAFLGAMAGSFVGGVLVDDKDMGDAVEEAVVAGIGGAGGAWGANLAGKLVKEGLEKGLARAADDGIAGAVKRHVDHKSGLVLVHGPRREGGLPAALGGGFGAYAVSPQSPQVVSIDTTDIGNGSCPAAMPNLRMPVELTGASAAGEMYLGLPGYLCSVWKSFGNGERTAPPAPELPEKASGTETAGVPDYSEKAEQLNTVMAGFAELDAKAVELIATGARRVSDEGHLAVGALIDTVNTRAGEAPPPETSVPTHALDILNDAFGQGREILAQAITANQQISGDVQGLTERLDALQQVFDEHMNGHAPGVSAPPGTLGVTPPGTPGVPSPPGTPGASLRPGTPGVTPQNSGTPEDTPSGRQGAPSPASGTSTDDRVPGTVPTPPGADMTSGMYGTVASGISTTPWTRSAEERPGAADPQLPETGTVTLVAGSVPPGAPVALSASSTAMPATTGAAATSGPATAAGAPPVAATGVVPAPAVPGRTPWTDPAPVRTAPAVGSEFAPVYWSLAAESRQPPRTSEPTEETHSADAFPVESTPRA
ncbi:hypothetical protein HGA13_15630 [Nocardia speluncae]|uniref:Uncharacterized protein n=1 Tax=Nocardia speluncae TaxID=419477 RepID=A0A846XEW1_9NOCA|nr:hypothetical protein [Nocardia speluncae]NKY34492.1 hypothetical protein [Nocardia speluncae]